VLARLLLLTALLFSLFSCKPPDPPTLTPKEIRVTAITPAGIDVLVRIEAVNPNRKDLNVRSVSGSMKLAGKYQLATVTITKPLVIPPAVPTMIDAPMTMAWADISTLGALGATQGPVPYVLSGTVAIGGDRLAINLPFSIQGTLTREQIAGAALKGLPPIPGFNAPLP
jgi:hypothetical protein